MTSAEFDSNPFAAPEAELGPLQVIPSNFKKKIAKFWPRFVGFLIDHVVLYVLMYLLFTLAGFVLMELLQSEGITQRVINLRRFFVIAALSLNPIYFAVLECSPWQATLGKRVVGLKVVDLKGQRLTFWPSCLRSLCRMLSYASILTGFSLPILTKKRQTLHDLLAGCLVIKE